jgi:NAD-dependent SIR2 family protein deacetylase
VFFGENVAPNTLAEAWRLFDDSDVLLVVGSSLAVFSGFRFARKADERGMPIVIINIGPTRADEIAALRIGERAGEFLPLLAERLVSQARMQECPE